MIMDVDITRTRERLVRSYNFLSRDNRRSNKQRRVPMLA